MMRALVVAPAEMEPHLFRRDVGDGMVERLDMELCALAELGGRERGILDVPAHGEVGAVELQHQAGRGDGLVFGRIASAMAKR